MFRCSTTPRVNAATEGDPTHRLHALARRPRAGSAWLGVLALLAAPAAQALEGADLVQVGQSIVKVEVLRTQGGYSLGSGVVVDDDRVVTNCHVTRDATQVTVLRGGLRYTAQAQAADTLHDLCVLAVPRLGAPAVALDDQPLQPGQTVSAIGFTGGQGLQHSPGQVVALHRYDGAQVIQSTNWFTSGASGGGLFTDTRQLAGVLTFRLRGGNAHYFSAPVAWLRPLLAEGALQPIAPLREAGVAFWEQPVTAQPRFLQAAVFAREHRWQELDSYASTWAREDQGDAQPWLMRGLAQQEQGRLPTAQRYIERALSIEPASRIALLRLGLVHLAQGHIDKAKAVLLKLQSLRSDLAGELDRALDRALDPATERSAERR